MSPPASDPPFLERQAYRRRRLMDAARILPVAGALLFALPLLWTGGADASTARTGLYLFAVWTLLIVSAALLARPLGRDAPAAGRGTGAADGQPD